jgi:hypothetical protein
MGYFDLLIKLAEVLVYILVKISLLLMKVFPWRMKYLEDKIKTGRSLHSD